MDNIDKELEKPTLTQKQFLELFKVRTGHITVLQLSSKEIEELIENSLIRTVNHHSVEIGELDMTRFLIKFFDNSEMGIIRNFAYGSITLWESEDKNDTYYVSLNTVHSNVRYEYKGKLSDTAIKKLQNCFYP